MKKHIGFIGTGLMGRGMARCLIRQGHRVRIYKRTRAKAEEVAQLGGTVAETPADAARGAEVVITMLADPAALLGVVEGEQGVLAGIQPGAVLIDSSTVSPPTTLRLLALLQAKGADMLDAPVFGSKNEAEKGELGFIVGGEHAVLARVQDVLDCMGRANHVGRSSVFIRHGFNVNQTRKMALGLSAALLPASLFIIAAPLNIAIVFFSTVMFGHQCFAAILQTLPTDLFPSNVVGTVGGLLGSAGSFGAMLFGLLVGWLVEHYGYNLAFIVILATVKRIEPIRMSLNPSTGCYELVG